MSAPLILGGTAEARELAGVLHGRGVPVVSSLAGRVAAPRLPPGEVRIGGFGGPEGLERWLTEHDVFAVVDATHPFAARHRIPLNRVGGAVQVTTGRRLAAGLPADADDVVVMLDPNCTFPEVAGEDVDIYWGAYLGTPDETLVSGPVTEVADEIEHLRAREKERKGWIFDTYLLRRK